ncbi:MAG: prolipoprotein diacylglyceryl transferase [Victivallaceae bacterium]|nr:prolipoprotein diacylglyceryl transferase [Victivallaceae bacterium]
MHPIALELGPLTIRWYGVMAALGFLAGSFVINHYRDYAKISSDQASTMLLLTIFSGIAGARAFYVIQFFDYYRNDLWEIVRIDHGGLVFYGGLVAIPVLILYAKVQKIDFARLLDITAPALVLGHAFGRIGCFLNGCCYGKITECCMGVIYPAGSAPAFADHLARHPIQLYESAENIVVFFFLTAVLKRTPRGCTVSAYLAVYGLLRFINEFFRGDNYRYFGMFTVAQLIGLGLIPLAGCVFGYFYHAGKKRA